MQDGIDIVFREARLSAGIDLTETAAAQRQLRAGLAGSRWRNEVDGAAQHGRTKSIGHLATIDFQRFRLPRMVNPTTRALPWKRYRRHCPLYGLS
jgi:hypothetical protein